MSIQSAQLELASIDAGQSRLALIYLIKADAAVGLGHLRYLHTLRSGSANAAGSLAGSHDAYAYYRALSGNLRIVEEWARETQFNVAMVARSSRHDAEPYFSAIYPHQRQCEDVSQLFSKSGERIGRANGSKEAAAAIKCEMTHWPPNAERLLIVDDVYSRGFTAAAIVYHLRNRARMPESVAISVFAPAWLAPTV